MIFEPRIMMLGLDNQSLPVMLWAVDGRFALISDEGCCSPDRPNQVSMEYWPRMQPVGDRMSLDGLHLCMQKFVLKYIEDEAKAREAFEALVGQGADGEATP